MKKTLRTLLMGMMALIAGNALTSCSNDEEPQVAQQEGKKGYVEFTLTRGADTRTAYTLNDKNGLDATWSEGDKVVVESTARGINEVFGLVSGAGTDTATFAKDDSSFAGNETGIIINYLPGVSDNIVDYRLDFSKQEGTLENLGKYEIIEYSGVKLENGKIITTGVTVKAKMAILRFPKGFDFGITNTTADLVLSGGANIFGPTLKDNKGDITIEGVKLTEGKLDADVYVAVLFSSDDVPTSLTIGGKVFLLPEITEAGKIYTLAEDNLKAAPLTLEATGEGTITISNPVGLTISYVKNAETRVTNNSDISISVVKGDVVRFYGDNATYCVVEPDLKYTNIQCTSDCYIYGNIMSLIDADGYETATKLTDACTFLRLFFDNEHIKNHDSKELSLPATTLTTACYSQIFRLCEGLTTVPALPATTLAEGCYEYMFANCTGLTTLPEKLLPATTLAESCYPYMFSGCSGLTTLPEKLLPATILAEGCYTCMFNDCGSLTTAPALPATTLADYCYSHMFYNCDNLTTAPVLPATTLAEGCYENMFANCGNLTIAPELPATILTKSCYTFMFYGCRSLNSVTCLATDISAEDCTFNWLNEVARYGTFIKAASMTSWDSGSSDIPSGWDVEDYKDPEDNG